MDTHIGPDIREQMKRDRRNFLIEEGEIISMDTAAKRAGMIMKLAVTPIFFNHFYPYGEDAVKGVTFDEILWDIIKIFKKETGGMVKNGMTFPIMSETYVKRATSHDNVETFSDGKARTKRTVVSAHLMPDENNNPSVVFGIHDHTFMK